MNPVSVRLKRLLGGRGLTVVRRLAQVGRRFPPVLAAALGNKSFAAEVINRVMHGPAWPQTLLIWLYDEHGGYYDHVPPPAAVAPDDVPAHNFQLDLPSWLRTLLRPLFGKAFAQLADIDAGPADYTRYGFRVPAVLVCPYARPGYLCRQTLDHTSVLKAIEEKWNLPQPTLRWGSWPP